MILRVTSVESLPWEGTPEELLERQDLPMFLVRRIENLRLGQYITPELGIRFRIERIM